MWSAALIKLEDFCSERLMQILNMPQFAESSPVVPSGEMNENTWKLTEGKVNTDGTWVYFCVTVNNKICPRVVLCTYLGTHTIFFELE